MFDNRDLLRIEEQPDDTLSWGRAVYMFMTIKYKLRQLNAELEFMDEKTETKTSGGGRYMAAVDRLEKMIPREVWEKI